MRALTLSEFEPRQGESFAVEGFDGTALRLSVVTKLPHSNREGGGFRLEFEGPREPVLPQATYRLHDGREAFDIFLVPVGQGPEAALYEAIFN